MAAAEILSLLARIPTSAQCGAALPIVSSAGDLDMSASCPALAPHSTEESMCSPKSPSRKDPGSTIESSTTQLRSGYEDTVQNLRIGKHTRVIYQGFTGRVATGNAKDSIAYGTNVVGGVTPGKEGEHIGLPLLPDLKKAKEQLKPDATAVFVAAPQCGQAIEQAIEAEIPLIVSVAEHIPVHDIMRVRFPA